MGSRLRFDTTLVVLQRAAGGPPIELAGIEIRQAGARDAAAYERDIGTDLAAVVGRRLAAAGSSCWLATSKDRIVHASWVARIAAWVGEADRFFVVPSGDAYIYESFTRPEMRGRGVYPAVLAAICAWGPSAGIGRLWIAAEKTNRPSLRAFAKAGFERSFEIEVTRRWGKTQVSHPGGVEPRLEEP